MLKENARIRYPASIREIGVCHYRGLCGVSEDEVEAFRWFQKVADADDGIAQYYVGLYYDTGKVQL